MSASEAATFILHLLRPVEATQERLETLTALLERLTTFLEASEAVVVYALGLLRRALTRAGRRHLDGADVEAFAIVAIVVASGMLEDATFSKRDWAALVRRSPARLVVWEARFLALLGFETLISRQEFEKVRRRLKALERLEVVG
ncbi:Cyclin family protein [Giardia muris]|uniref:Cyclin family protein n=1 Tax=Giardia muris TaxID=5742 RepID=A0A4Z1T1E5_GIAMU|nr:Cyclin family protein [Giardia muris]|eukprot:TNJ26359.1 Cyclin family protein [Giardia muris]